MEYWTGESQRSLTSYGWMNPARMLVSALRPSLGLQQARMNLQSLDLSARECDGPPALIRPRLVPTCMRPQHLPGGNPRRPEPNPILCMNQPGFLNDADIITIGELERPLNADGCASNSRIISQLCRSDNHARIGAIEVVSVYDGSVCTPLIRRRNARNWPFSVVRRTACLAALSIPHRFLRTLRFII